MISFYYSFGLFDLLDQQKAVFSKISHNLTTDNLTFILRLAATLSDNETIDFCYWLIKHIVNVKQGIEGISWKDNKIETLLKCDLNSISIGDDEIRIKRGSSEICKKLNFLYETELQAISKNERFFTVDNVFYIGKVKRTKNESSLTTTYPHIFELTLENEPSFILYALQESENSKFTLSLSASDFTLFGPNYVGLVDVNYWGTTFTVYDRGYDEKTAEKFGLTTFRRRRKVAEIVYANNILGDSPREFTVKLGERTLSNIKPKWSSQSNSYVLNFYGRVKKASARNFQLTEDAEEDVINLQHGKESKNLFNLDFMQPFSPLIAFAVSLVSISKKRVVS